MNLRKRMEFEKAKLEKQLEKELERIATLPEGDLHVYKNNDHFDWYITDDNHNKNNNNNNNNSGKDNKGKYLKNLNEDNSENKTINAEQNKVKRTYLPKSERSLAEQLALKGYLNARMRDNIIELKATNSYLNICRKSNFAEKYLNQNQEIHQLVATKIVSQDAIVSEWLASRYTGPPRNPEQLIYETKAGFKVRSKSEKKVVNNLFDAGIPLKYEDKLHVNCHDIYPDFTIMNPHTHKVYIWEHFGKMDDYGYRKNNMPKIDDYAVLGYHLGENLLLTFETRTSDIDEDTIRFYIEHYFT